MKTKKKRKEEILFLKNKSLPSLRKEAGAGFPLGVANTPTPKNLCWSVVPSLVIRKGRHHKGIQGRA